MHQPPLRRTGRSRRATVLAVLAAVAVLVLPSLAPAAGAADVQVSLPATTVLHVHLVQAGGTLAAPRAVPREVEGAARTAAETAHQPLRLLGSAVLTTANEVHTRIAGPAGLPGELRIDLDGRTAEAVHVRALEVAGSLHENRRPESLLATSATLPLGEPVVAGTSYLGPEHGTLIVVLQADDARAR